MNRLAVIAGALALALMSGPAVVAAAGPAMAGATHYRQESTPLGHPTFADLDVDGNGVLSPGEAGGRKGLLDYWNQIDRNQDQVIERSEFAAFEASGVSGSEPTIPLWQGEGTMEGH